MRGPVGFFVMLLAACQPEAPAQVHEPAAKLVSPPEPARPAQEASSPPTVAESPPPPINREPELDPKGVTAEQAAIDVACERRDRLPRAMPFPQAKAISETGRAEVRDGKVVVGRFSFKAIDETNPEAEGYFYAGKYAAADVDIVAAWVDLGVGWTLVNQGAGQLEVPHLLIPSPDGRLWATSTDSPAPYGQIKLYAIEPDQWTKVAEVDVANACGLHWIDSSTLSFRTSADDDKPLSPEQHLTLAAGKWVLKP